MLPLMNLSCLPSLFSHYLTFHSSSFLILNEWNSSVKCMILRLICCLPLHTSHIQPSTYILGPKYNIVPYLVENILFSHFVQPFPKWLWRPLHENINIFTNMSKKSIQYTWISMIASLSKCFSHH